MTEPTRELTLRRLGASGQRWIRASLEAGDDLSQIVVGLIDLDRGEVVTYVPADMPENVEVSSDYFNPDGPRSLSEGLQAAAATLQLARDVADGQMLVVEDGALVRDVEAGGDPSVEADSVVVIGERVLRWQSLQSGSPEDAVDFIGNHQPGVNTFVVGGHRKSFQPMERLTEDALREIAESTRAILTGAFDGVSYALWRHAGVDKR